MNLPIWINSALTQFSFMSPVVLLLLKMTFLLVIAWLVHFNLANVNPRIRVLLWRGVVLGLTILIVWNPVLPGLKITVPSPVILTSATGNVINHIEPSPEEHSKGEQAPLIPHNPAHDRISVSNESINLSTDSTEPVQSSIVSNISIPWKKMIYSLWGMGVVLLFVRLGLGILRLKKLCNKTTSASNEIVEEVRRINQEMGYGRSVNVRTSSHIAVPIILGIRRPVIVLPERMCEPSFQKKLPAIIAHELSHANSRDVFWNITVHAMQIFLWFHPFVWKIGSVHRRHVMKSVTLFLRILREI